MSMKMGYYDRLAFRVMAFGGVAVIGALLVAELLTREKPPGGEMVLMKEVASSGDGEEATPGSPESDLVALEVESGPGGPLTWRNSPGEFAKVVPAAAKAGMAGGVVDTEALADLLAASFSGEIEWGGRVARVRGVGDLDTLEVEIRVADVDSSPAGVSLDHRVLLEVPTLMLEGLPEVGSDFFFRGQLDRGTGGAFRRSLSVVNGPGEQLIIRVSPSRVIPLKLRTIDGVESLARAVSESQLARVAEKIHEVKRELAIGRCRPHGLLRTEGGVEYHEAKVVSADDVGIAIEHRDGAARISYERLGEEWREQFGYDAARAEAAIAEEKYNDVRWMRAATASMRAANQKALTVEGREKLKNRIASLRRYIDEKEEKRRDIEYRIYLRTKSQEEARSIDRSAAYTAPVRKLEAEVDELTAKIDRARKLVDASYRAIRK